MHAFQNQPICKYYNPYFSADCERGDKCFFKHLDCDQWVEFCTTFNRNNRFSSTNSTLLDQAFNCLTRCDSSNALRILCNLRSAYPYASKIIFGIARCHQHTGNNSLAGFNYRRAISMKPNNAKYHAKYALHLWKQLHDIKQAKYRFEQSLQIKATHVTHREYATLLRIELTDYKNAEYHYTKAIELCPQDVIAHKDYAIMLDEIDADSNKIKYHFEQALKFMNEFTVDKLYITHYLYGIYLKKIRDHSLSIYHLKQCIKQSENFAMAHYSIG
eukprot:174197_1